jgi:putative thioredoxin
VDEVVRDVAESAFDTAVVEASRERAVVVDFWAPWCGPCHQLSPMLERAAQRHASDVTVVKVNVDQAPALSQRYGIQGIPAVKAFRDGAVVAEFTGVQPEAAIDRFFAALVPTESDRLVAQAAGAGDQARALLEAALEADPGHRGATLALARILAEDGDTEGARGLLERLPADPDVRRLQAELSLRDVSDGDVDDLRAAVESGDLDARLPLGKVLAARGRHEEALRVLLAAVAHPQSREEARLATLDVFEVLGADHPLVRTYRPKLAAALY